MRQVNRAGEAGIDAIGEQLVERTVVLRRTADGEEPLVKYVANPRCKAEAQVRTQSEHVGRVAKNICEVLVDVEIRFVIAQPINDCSASRSLELMT